VTALRCDRLVIVFARLPPDERRAKPLVDGARGRAVEALHERLLGRTLAVARSTGVRTRLATSGVARAIAGVEVVQQIGASFAERLERAVGDAFAEGFREVIVIGADTPELETRHLEHAFALLASGGARAVIGPACDGGYYLLALNEFAPRAFRQVPLCTRDACRATVAALARAGFAIATLPALRDIDGDADVRWLSARGGSLARVALALLARSPRHTRAQLPIASRSLAILRSRGPPASAPSTI
jgi:glycosyltransferase A (GT-A) superfamily protein (DUF2064 family)